MKYLEQLHIVKHLKHFGYFHVEYLREKKDKVKFQKWRWQLLDLR